MSGLAIYAPAGQVCLCPQQGSSVMPSAGLQDYIYEYGEDYYPTTGKHGKTRGNQLLSSHFWTSYAALYCVCGDKHAGLYIYTYFNL